MNTEVKSETTDFMGERSRKLLKVSKVVTKYQKQYYEEVKERAARGEPVIWTNVGVPTEIMNAMNIPIVYPLHLSALLAAKQMSAHCLCTLNERGYFRDLCRYCSQPLGYFLETEPEQGMWGGFPKPAALVTEASDDPIIRIWELMARRLNVPLYIWDHTMIAEPPAGPFWETVEDIEDFSYKEGWRLDYAIKETEGLVSFVETVTGRTLSESKLKAVIERSNEQFDYIGKAMDLCTKVPAPIGIADHMPNLISTQFFRGHEFGLEQAKRLFEEIKERVDKGLVACKNERLRLMYLIVPNWFSPGFYQAFEEKYGAVFVWMMYLTVIPRQLIRRDLRDPLKALAARYVHYAELGLPPWLPRIVAYEAKKFKIDGVVYQEIESCRMLSGAILHTIRALEEVGIPTCQIEGDMVDIRDWDDKKMKSKVASFVETLL